MHKLETPTPELLKQSLRFNKVSRRSVHRSSLRSKAIEHFFRTSAKDNDRNGFNVENFKNQSYSSFTLAPERLRCCFQGTSALAQGFFTGKMTSEGCM